MMLFAIHSSSKQIALDKKRKLENKTNTSEKKKILKTTLSKNIDEHRNNQNKALSPVNNNNSIRQKIIIK